MTVEIEPVRLIQPYGEALVNLLTAEEAPEELRLAASRLPALRLSARELCDLEMLATGAFSPLDRFMSREDVRRVTEEMRLANGYVFPIPVTLSVKPGFTPRLDQQIALVNERNDLLAVMTIEEIYGIHPDDVAQQVFGTRDHYHPGVAELTRSGTIYLSGNLQVLRLPDHHDFKRLRLTPAETRARLQQMGRENVVAFQTRNPLHRAHEEMTKRALQLTGGTLLLHPVVGMTKPGDVDHFTRVRTYQMLAERYYESGSALLALLPLAMRMAGPREALWHAVIRRNFGANHLIVGRDHASPGRDSTGKPYYDPLAAQQLVEGFSEEIGVRPVCFSEFVYLPEAHGYEETTGVPAGARTLSLSGTEAREEYLNRGRLLPEWFTRREVAEILLEAHPPRDRQGFCIWFTGLSGAGKSTTAEHLVALLLEQGRNVTLLDGDVVRLHLSKGLGFSREDRDANILRIGFVAAEIVKHGGAVVCAAISPYRETRDQVRQMVGSDYFIEVFVDTPLELCELRDPKGMYAKARRGEITGFTGVDDPYEPPPQPELTLDTIYFSPEENARQILGYLTSAGYVRGNRQPHRHAARG
jgi:sulfate adenylyltransferase